MKSKENNKIKPFLFVPIGMIIFVGFLWFMMPSFLNSPVMDESFTEYVNANTPARTFTVSVGFGRIYKIEGKINATSDTVITGVRIEREDGRVVWDRGAGSRFYPKEFIFLKAGEYHVMFDFDTQEEKETPVKMSFVSSQENSATTSA